MTPSLSTFCLVWMVSIVVLYLSALMPEISLNRIAGVLPILSGPNWPSFPYFAGKVSTLIAVLAWVLLAGRLTGRRVVSFLRLGKIGDLRVIPLGWMAVSFLYVGLGLTGLWYPRVMIFLAFALLVANLPGRWNVPRLLPGLLSGPVVLMPLVMVGWMLLLMSIAPAIYQDPLRYHLFIPEQFLLARKCYFMPDFFFWAYFGPIHVLYAAAQAIGGQMGAQSVNLAAAFLSFAAACRIASMVGLPIGDQRLMLGLALSAPGLLLVTGCTFAEHGHALYVLLALEWLLVSGAPFRRRARAVALLVGHAFAAKYTAVFGIAGLAAVLVSMPDRWALAGALLSPSSLCLMAVPFVPWGFWNWMHTLDPISPSLAGLGFATHDHSSGGALKRYYSFIHATWLGSPAKLLGFPLDYAGAHVSYWECPGPAIPGLLLVALLTIRFVPSLQMSLALFCLGGVLAWLVLFGGGSPHYVSGYAGAWIAGCLASVSALRRQTGVWLRNLLTALVFIQVLIGLSSAGGLRDPRQVALGAETRQNYLGRMLQPENVSYPLRDWLNQRLNRNRDRVLVYGDDNGAYLNCRVRLDLERSADILLWRLAEKSFGPDDVRRQLRQRGLTWMIYSFHWSVLLAEDVTLDSRLSPRELKVLQDFWRRWADPVIGAYPAPGVNSSPAWAVRFRDKPRTGPVVLDRWRQPEVLPGTLSWFWPGVSKERKGDLAGAVADYREVLDCYPDYALARFQMARLLFEQGDLREARLHLDKARKLGWMLKEAHSWLGEESP